MWWAFLWRAAVFGFLAGFVIGAIGGFIMGFAGMPNAAVLVGKILGTIVYLPVSLLVLRHILGKKYASFSIEFVQSEG